MHEQRYQGGLWVALFLILLLPFFFLRTGSGYLTPAMPVLGLKASLPRAQLAWEYYGQAGHVPCWAGGGLVKKQLIMGDAPAVLVALAADGAVLWQEETFAPFKAISNGRQILLAADNGQVSEFSCEQGLLWSEATGWVTQALTLASEGEVAVAQGPVLENESNLLERVRLYSAQGELLAEHRLRNSSALCIVDTPGAWLVSSVILAQDQPRGQLLRLTASQTETQTLWHSEDMIHALVAGNQGVATAAGNKVHIVPLEGTAYDIQLKNTVLDLAWGPDEFLAVIQAGDSPLAPGYVALLTGSGDIIWQRRLRGPCRALAVRGDEVLTADNSTVYAYSIKGDINWCYESKAPLQGIYPLADKKEVVVTTVGKHLLLLEPPD